MIKKPEVKKSEAKTALKDIKDVVSDVTEELAEDSIPESKMSRAGSRASFAAFESESIKSSINSAGATGHEEKKLEKSQYLKV